MPGAGRTLVSLRFVYESCTDSANSIFLSGKGYFVEVLRGALKAKEFVRDLHGSIKTTYADTIELMEQYTKDSSPSEQEYSWSDTAKRAYRLKG